MAGRPPRTCCSGASSRRRSLQPPHTALRHGRPGSRAGPPRCSCWACRRTRAASWRTRRSGRGRRRSRGRGTSRAPTSPGCRRKGSPPGACAWPGPPPPSPAASGPRRGPPNAGQRCQGSGTTSLHSLHHPSSASSRRNPGSRKRIWPGPGVATPAPSQARSGDCRGRLRGCAVRAGGAGSRRAPSRRSRTVGPRGRLRRGSRP
mmetsp:Transcript_43385/g.134101  ORF Transcript_43385/g.134101 Transcript_43385/m.134101 type:complete len:204 (-) Transcript_43385:156-767(-)